jgi:hypothetical protein
MHPEIRQDWIVALACILVFVTLACGILVIAEVSCTRRWEASGFQTRWGVMSGCLVKTGDRWIPDDALREFLSR